MDRWTRSIPTHSVLYQNPNSFPTALKLHSPRHRPSAFSLRRFLHSGSKTWVNPLWIWRSETCKRLRQCRRVRMQYQSRRRTLLGVPRNRSAARGDLRLLLGRNLSLSLWLGWQVSFDREFAFLHWLQHSNLDWNVFPLQIISRWNLSQIFVVGNLQEVERLHWCIDWWRMSRPHANEAMFSILIQLWRLFHILQT